MVMDATALSFLSSPKQKPTKINNKEAIFLSAKLSWNLIQFGFINVRLHELFIKEIVVCHWIKDILTFKFKLVRENRLYIKIDCSLMSIWSNIKFTSQSVVDFEQKYFFIFSIVECSHIIFLVGYGHNTVNVNKWLHVCSAMCLFINFVFLNGNLRKSAGEYTKISLHFVTNGSRTSLRCSYCVQCTE